MVKNKAFFILLIVLSHFGFAQCITSGNQNGSIGSGGIAGPQGDLKNFFEWTIKAVVALDPNDITGPKGFAEKQFVSVKDQLPFTVRYENMASMATAPAQNVFIRLPLDPKVDINSFRLGSFGFGSYTFTVPENVSFYTTRLDLQDSLGLFVDVLAGIDVIRNEAFWTFRSIDPETGVAPADAMKGFLPVNDTSARNPADSLPGKGEGYVTFFVSPQSGAATNDSVSAKASIVFDINEEIPTNTWVNTIDAVAPTSRIVNHAITQNTIKLIWSGQDDAKGSGVRDYALYVSEDGAPFKLFQNKIAATTIDFTGTPGSRYCFFTLATDNTGNQEALKKECNFAVELNGMNIPLPVTWLYFKGAQQTNDVLLSWATTSERNTKEFVVERSLDGSRFSAIGTVQAHNPGNHTSNYQHPDAGAILLNTKMLYYRLKQVDKDGNFIYSTVVAIPVNRRVAQATIDAYPNPFSQQITLKIKTVSSTDQTDKVALYTQDGRLVYQKRLAQRGSATILLQDLPNLAPGAYLLEVVIDKKLYSVKLIRE